MQRLMSRLWQDDGGALISTEFLFVATILILGIITGLVIVRDAVVKELYELAGAIGALNQSYSFSGLSGCHVSVAGSGATDVNNTASALTSVAPDVAIIEAPACP